MNGKIKGKIFQVIYQKIHYRQYILRWHG